MRKGKEVQYPVSGQVVTKNEQAYAKDVIDSGQYTYGHYNKAFAKSLCRYLQTRFAVLTNSGSSANLVALSALLSPKLENHLNPGDKVLTTALSFPTTVNAILRAGLQPVFIDSDLVTFNYRPSELLRAVQEHDIKAIIFTHTLGNAFQVDYVQEIMERYNIKWFIEDNCDALGSEVSGKKTGSFGNISTLSFYPAHHINTGEGGAVLTDDPDLYMILRSYNEWGRDCYCNPGFDNTCGKRFEWQLGDLPYGYDHKYTYSHIGYNCQMTHMQAALGFGQMEEIENFVEKRRYNWKYLLGGFEEFEEYFFYQKPDWLANPSWFGFGIVVKATAPFKRRDIVEKLEQRGVATRLLFAGNILKQPAYKGLFKPDLLFYTNYLMNNAFWIGVFPEVSLEMMNHGIYSMRESLKELTL